MTKQSSSNRGTGVKQLAELWNNLRLAWRLLRDPVVSVGPKLIPIAALLYILFPLDLFSDLVPVLGQLDDLAVLLLGLRFFIAACPKQAVQRHVAQMDSVEASYTVVESDQGGAADRTGHEILALSGSAHELTLSADGASPQDSDSTPHAIHS